MDGCFTGTGPAVMASVFTGTGPIVMTGLVPAIRASAVRAKMAGTGPAMTAAAAAHLFSDSGAWSNQ